MDGWTDGKTKQKTTFDAFTISYSPPCSSSYYSTQTHCIINVKLGFIFLMKNIYLFLILNK